MDCSQILPGAVNSGPCSLATGYYNEHPFIVYASGRDIVILDGRLKHVQTLLGSDLGYGETPINCVDTAELVGKIAVSWGSDVVFFYPEPLEDNQVQNNNEFPGHWILSHTIPVDYSVLSLSWNKEGKQLLVGGDALSLWSYSAEESVTSLLPPDPNSSGEGCQGVWGESWRCSLAQPAVYLSFSPDGAMFASASQDDHFVKIWYQSKIGMYMCCVYNTYVLTGI
ncbi:DmX-like protein 1, partial [Geodia barretti]